MNLEETIEAIEVMQHFVNGGRAQYQPRLSHGDKWINVSDDPQWNWSERRYRIKPKAVEIWSVLNLDQVVAIFNSEAKARDYAGVYGVGFRVVYLTEPKP
jgi:hypothetical protein